MKTMACIFLGLVAVGAALADDWPTYMHDNQRSGLTAEGIIFPLQPAWTHEARPPQPSWTGGPAKQNFWWGLDALVPKVEYDRALHVVAASGRLYFGSSADDQVHCLDAATGEEQWRFFTEGPVRLAPYLYESKVFVGSDDGAVYCLAGGTGALQWKYRPTAEDRRIMGNGRMISRWPVRTGVVVQEGTLYFGAGLFPREGVYLCALDPGTGREIWKHEPALSMQGYVLASPTRLYMPTGRTSPTVFDRKTGKQAGTLAGEGGAFALLAGDIVLHGPGHTGKLEVSDVESRDRIATFMGRHVIVTPGKTILHTGREISVLDRIRYMKLARERMTLGRQKAALAEERKGKEETARGKKIEGEMARIQKRLDEIPSALEQCMLWQKPMDHGSSMILADEILLVGGMDQVEALHVDDGALVWQGAVKGEVLGLAVADGMLFVSTDTGCIHAFKEGS